MCRYKFGEGKCSHPNNMALECVGEDKCQFNEEEGAEVLSEPEEQDDVRSEEERSDGCPNTKIGIYCKKYRHFHCAGEDNCQTREEYIEHLKEHKEAVQNIEHVQSIEEDLERKD